MEKGLIRKKIRKAIFEGMGINDDGSISETMSFIIVRASKNSIGYEILDHASTEEEAIQKTEQFKSQFPDHIIDYKAEEMFIDLNTLEGFNQLVDLVKAWGGSVNQKTTYGYSFEIPISHKNDLKEFGVFDFEIQRVTNREHPDFGKIYLELNLPKPTQG